MKKMILKLLVVTLFFQSQVVSANDDAKAIESFNQMMSSSTLGNLSPEEYDQLMEANESEGEEELTAAEIKSLNSQQIKANESINLEDIAGINNISELQQDTTARTRKVGGNWGVHFIYISKDGQRKVLTAQNIHAALTPASTMKVFSGYLAFLNNSISLNSLSNTLHVSSNPGAQAALVSVGGNTARSVSIMKKTYASLEDISKLRAIDGSGLSRANKVTARLETALLEKIFTDGKYNTFKQLMAQPGQWGTMRAQLTDIDTDSTNKLEGKINIYAKTGTLPRGRVKGLTGFVESDKGIIIFSLVANGVNVGPAKLAMQQIVRAHTLFMKSQGAL